MVVLLSPAGDSRGATHGLEEVLRTLRLPALLLSSVGMLTACGGSSPTSLPSSATTAPPAGRSFVSTLYGYAVTSPDWTGTTAKTAWDGTGSPGDADPAVDTLLG